MYLTKTQIAGLQWAAGQIETMPKSNTLDSLHSRNLLTVSAQSLHVLTAAGQEELLLRGLDTVMIDLSTDDKIPHCPHGCGQLQNADDAWICLECGDEWASDFYGITYALKSDTEHQAEERLDVKLFGKPQHGETLAIDPGNPPGFSIDSLTELQTELMTKMVAAHRTINTPIERRRAKNRTARKSRRVNRRRAR